MGVTGAYCGEFCSRQRRARDGRSSRYSGQGIYHLLYSKILIKTIQLRGIEEAEGGG